MAKEISPRKVVVRTRDGRVVPGFAKQEELEKGRLRITTQEGKEQEFDIEELKAVFFVRDFRGNPEYEEVKFLDKQKAPPMIWVQVEFFDGEVLEGKIPNNKELLFSQGFYLWPSDPDSNNQCVYISKSAVTNLTILSAL